MLSLPKLNNASGPVLPGGSQKNSLDPGWLSLNQGQNVWL